MPPPDKTLEGSGPASLPPDAAKAPVHTAELYNFRTGSRITPDTEDSDKRYSQRATDQLTTSFYEACKAGDMRAALQLMEALECEVVRSCSLFGGDRRKDGHDVAEVRARYKIEMARASSAKLLPAIPI